MSSDAFCAAASRGVIHQRGFREEFLRGGDGLDHLLDFRLQVVTLIHHVGDLGRVAGLPRIEADLVEDAEHLVRIDGAERQVVIGIAAVVEVESAEHAVVQQPRDDLLDVLRLVVVPGIDQHPASSDPAVFASRYDMPQSAMSV